MHILFNNAHPLSVLTSVPFSLAVASSLPLLLSASAASEELCAEMNLVRRVSYSSTRT